MLPPPWATSAPPEWMVPPWMTQPLDRIAEPPASTPSSVISAPRSSAALDAPVED